jgi:hypothetical protein
MCGLDLLGEEQHTTNRSRRQDGARKNNPSSNRKLEHHCAAGWQQWVETGEERTNTQHGWRTDRDGMGWEEIMRFGWKQSSRRNSNRDDYYPRDALGIGFGSQLLLPFCAASSIAVIKTKPFLFLSVRVGAQTF